MNILHANLLRQNNYYSCVANNTWIDSVCSTKSIIYINTHLVSVPKKEWGFSGPLICLFSLAFT